MPSLWGWVLKGKHKINSKKKQETTEKSDILYKQKEYLNPKTRNKEAINSTDLHSDLNSSFINDQSRLGNVSHKPKGTESVLKDEKKDKVRQVEDLTHDSCVSNGRLPVYKIFGDEYRPMKNVDRDRRNYQPSPELDNSPAFPQQKQLFHLHQEKETVDITGVEMRPKKSDLFGGLASRFHRHSLQMELPVHGSDSRKRPEFKKCETMAGYVPRAVCLHDASAILSGGIMEETMLSKNVDSKVYYKPHPHDSRHRFSNLIPDSIPCSSYQRNQLVNSREGSKDVDRYVSRNIKQAPNRNNKTGKSSALNSKKSGQNVAIVKSSPSNENFYFSSTMLEHIRSGPRDSVSSSFEDADTSGLTCVGKETAEAGAPLKNRLSRPDINSGGDVGKDALNSSNEFWFSKTYSMNSQDVNTISDLPDRTSRSKTSHDANTDGDVNSVLAHLEKVIDGSSGPNDVTQLEVIFNTEGEVLY